MRKIAALGTIVLILLLAVGTAAVTPDEDQAKIIVIIFGVYEKGAFFESAEVRYGHAPNLGHQQGNFTVVGRAYNGTQLFAFDVWDPRYQVDELGYYNELECHKKMEESNPEPGYEGMAGWEHIDLPLIIPYHHDIRTIDLVEKDSGTLLVSANLSCACQEFMKRFPRDPDAVLESLPEAGQQDLLPVTATGIAIVLLAVLVRLIRRS
jgi:hypothetical protein